MPKKLIEGKTVRHEKIGKDVFLLSIDLFAETKNFKAGQFIQLRLPDNSMLLRRPLSIADTKDTQIILIYRVVGKGTQLLAKAQPGQKLSVLGPLGNGFTTKDCLKPLLVGGGLGIAPLLLLAKKFHGKADIIMGCKNKEELSWPLPLFKNQVKKIFLTTDDGSLGNKGFVAQYLPEVLTQHDYDKIFICGPEIMMRTAAKAAEKYHKICEVSLEKYMACGLGACLGCTIETKNGRKKICKDGPVFDSREVFFDA